MYAAPRHRILFLCSPAIHSARLNLQLSLRRVFSRGPREAVNCRESSLSLCILKSRKDSSSAISMCFSTFFEKFPQAYFFEMLARRIGKFFIRLLTCFLRKYFLKLVKMVLRFFSRFWVTFLPEKSHRTLRATYGWDIIGVTATRYEEHPFLP